MAEALKLQSEYSLGQKLKHLNWGFIGLLTLVACIGFIALYSAANGSFDPWASRQMLRFGIGVSAMVVVALIDIRWWYKLAYPLYFLGLVSLIIVEIMGHVGKGAQRWIDLGFIQLQPSEFMKIFVIMALAKYFHAALPEDMRSLRFLIPPAFLVLAPVTLVLLQPDLGTSLMILMAAAAMVFLAGASLWLFAGGLALVFAIAPVIWHFMHDYQKERVLVFLNPESDPLGAGYHILQSKIALGAGGVEGKGFMKGTQSHLNFLPEKQTDFIFTLWAEEWGLLGGLSLLSLMGLVFAYGAWIAMHCRNSYGRLLAFGLTFNFSLYVFINVAMVMGLIPVVGAPLPLISYGGTAMLAVLIGFGLVMSCHIHRDAKLPRM